VLASFLISLAVAFIYGLFFAQREDKIRAFLSAKRKGWSRRRYVMAFVGAVRGEAVATDTRLLAYTWLFLVSCLVVFVYVMSGHLTTQMAEIDMRNKVIEAGIEGRGPTKESIETQVQALRADVLAIKSKFALLIKVTHITSVVGYVLVYAAVLFWLPFVVMRKRFAFELERFALRIQGLASKTELAELALAESGVVGEEGLRAFVKKAGAIAERHGIPQLVKTFDLWGLMRPA
jgi:hypothetical protein